MEVLNKSHFSLQMGKCPIPVAEHSGRCHLWMNPLPPSLVSLLYNSFALGALPFAKTFILFPNLKCNALKLEVYYLPILWIL